MDTEKTVLEKGALLKKDVDDMAATWKVLWDLNMEKNKVLHERQESKIQDLTKITEAALENSESLMNASLNLSLALDTEQLEKLAANVAKIEAKVAEFEKSCKEVKQNRKRREK